MTIDWLFIGFALGFVSAAWICPAVNKAIKKIREKMKEHGNWISVKDRMPEPETEVLIVADRNGYKVVTTAMYEDGKMSTEDSAWNWYDTNFDYDEESDLYLIPEGWWEYRHYNAEEVWNNAVDDPVTHWMPLPGTTED